MAKRILIIVAFFLVIGLMAAGIYFVLFRQGTVVTTPPTVEPGGEGTGPGGLPTAGEGVPTPTPTTPTGTALPVSEVAEGGLTETTRLTAASVAATTLAGDGRSVSYYDSRDGRFYTINEDGEVVSLSDTTFPNADEIVWSDDADQVVVEFPDGANVVYNFDTEEQTTLPAHWEDFDFAPDGTQIVAKSMTNDPNARTLLVTNPDASNTQVVAELGDNADQVQVNWSPNDQVIAFSDTGTTQSGFGRTQILPIGQNEENYKGLIVEGVNFHGLWSSDGARILYDVAGETSDYKPLLWIVDGSPATMGDNRRSLGLFTWVDKCTFFDADTVYCAVPQLLDDNIGLQPELASTQDAVYEIDIDTGKVTLIGIPEIATDMSHLRVSTDESNLYYTDAQGRLQLMKLK